MIINITNLNEKFWGLFSLAMKAGKLSVGEGRAEDDIKSGKVSLVVISSDASENTKKKFTNMTKFRDIPIISVGDRTEMGRAIGKKFAVTVAVCDNGFTDGLLKIALENIEY